jgi:adenylylsulfate kinase
MSNSKNIVWSESDISPEEREQFLKQKGCVVWLTGLSGSGKSTIAKELEKRLFSMGKIAYILDGDNIRSGLCSDLGFSIEDRSENMRRIGETAALFAHAGIIAITAFISPFLKERETARSLLQEGRFFEVFLDTPLKTCEERDPKGLYKKARSGEIPSFTGIDSPYEKPVDPELTIKTENENVSSAVEAIINLLRKDCII